MDENLRTIRRKLARGETLSTKDLRSLEVRMYCGSRRAPSQLSNLSANDRLTFNNFLHSPFMTLFSTARAVSSVCMVTTPRKTTINSSGMSISTTSTVQFWTGTIVSKEETSSFQSDFLDWFVILVSYRM